jgi:hypothetical protein
MPHVGICAGVSGNRYPYRDPGERRFRDDGTKAPRFCQPNDGDDRMNENDEDVVHAGIVSKSQETPEFRPLFVIRHRQVMPVWSKNPMRYEI